MKIIKWLDDNFEGTLMVLLLVAISCVMLSQTIARYVFNSSMPWPEEFSRYCYIWTVFLSLGYTIKKGSMLRVGIVMDLLPTKLRNAIKIFTDLLMLVVFIVFFQHSLQVIGNIRATGQTSTAMQLPMWIMYLSTATGFGLATIRMVQTIVYGLRHFGDRAESTLEATLKEAQAEAEMAKQDLQGGEA